MQLLNNLDFAGLEIYQSMYNENLYKTALFENTKVYQFI